ncbi:MAG: hypothetical protein AAFX79_06170 [Planctomycetota bacterium]
MDGQMGSTDILMQALAAARSPEAAGVLVVVGLMLWAAGARAVSIALAAVGGSLGLAGGLWASRHLPIEDVAGVPSALLAASVGAAIGVIAALAAMRAIVCLVAGSVASALVAAGILVALGLGFEPLVAHQPADGTPIQATAADAIQAASPLVDLDPAAAMTLDASAAAEEGLRDLWGQIPEDIRGYALLAIVAAGIGGAVVGASSPGRINAAATAFFGAALWPLGTGLLLSARGESMDLDAVRPEVLAAGWLVLGVAGVAIQRFVLRRLDDS